MGTTSVTTAKPAQAPSANPEWKPTGDTAKDLQGLAISAYPKHLVAMALMIRFPAPGVGDPKGWITDLTPQITNATGPRPISINVAFSAAGLLLLGIDAKDDESSTFSRPFRQGMTTDARARFLGDDPSKWQWSDCESNTNCIHAQLLIYALEEPDLGPVVATEEARVTKFGLQVASRLPLRVHLNDAGDRQEHFGFADGISQPILIDGTTPAEKRALHEIPVGEVILGQRNTYDVPAPGPVVAATNNAREFLQPAAVQGLFDLGLNGTYLVIRQLKQDVAKFWNNMKTASSGLVDEAGQPATDVWLAQKAVGRTLDGKMLTPAGPVAGNAMTYFAADRAGFGCPITSHVRRANPRDGLAPKADDTKGLIDATNRHRIVRRGRIYGEPIKDRYDENDTVDRGLLFICMNSEIERQFEVVQHTWLLNRMFGLGFSESDPILGPQCPFSIPSKPIRQQPTIDTFITPVGGGYFFLPSLRALQYLGAV